MTENLPGYVSITFILTTFLTVGILLDAVKQKTFETLPAKLLIFALAFWLLFQAALGQSGFFRVDTFPPRLILIGVFPALVLILAYFAFFRTSFIEKLPLKTLTFIHIIRIPVELVLLWLYQNKLVPQSMTFEGTNFDILSGISAPIVVLLAFRGDKLNRPLLIVWNIIALGLLINIVVTAISAFPTFSPNIAPELQNRAVVLFPYVWLPTVVVPIVLFSHLVSLWKLFKKV